jgi:hypothetical protein
MNTCPNCDDLHRAYIKVVAELAELRVEEADTGALVTRQAEILNAVADALHGGPLQDGWWSHHDLADIALKMRAAVDMLLERSAATLAGLSVTVGEEVTDPHADRVRLWLESLK